MMADVTPQQIAALRVDPRRPLATCNVDEVVVHFTRVFINDSPGFIASAYRHGPEVCPVHFLHDERFARHVESFDFVSLRTHSWGEAGSHVLDFVEAKKG